MIGTLSGTTYTISGTPTVSGSFPYTVTTTGNGCTIASTTGTITVSPIHTISLTSGSNAPTLCINTLLGTNIVYTIGGGATAAGIIGLPAGMIGTLSGTTYTISGTPSVSGSFPYTVTTTGNGCTIATATGTITVSPIHTISLTSGSTIPSLCINTLLGTNIVYTIGGGATAAGVTGLPAGMIGTLSGTTYTISGTPTVSGSFAYTITTTGNACIAATASGSVNVQSALPASVNIAGTTTICSGTSVTFTATPTNGGTPSYQWYVGATPVGTNSATYTSAALANGNVVTVQMTSTATCAIPVPAISNALTMNVTSVTGALNGTYAIPSICFPTVASAAAYLNTNGISGAVTFNVAAGHIETAPVGGISLTATGVAGSPIIFKKSGVGANPTITAFTPQAVGVLTDAVFKIIGGDYITIDGFTLQENAGNTVVATAATNTMTEFGIGLLYASVTNGAQNNTFQNNTISLNRTYPNSFGIYSNTRHSSTSVTVSAEVTSATGANSFNKIYTNTISNVNFGIVFIGAGTTIAAIDNGNDIGGSSLATGNTITNWGGLAQNSSFVSLTGSNYCIFSNQQINDNISFNTITSAAMTSLVTEGGILKNYSVAQPVGTITTSINNNTVTITNNPSAATTGNIIAINNQGLTPLLSTATVNMNNNTVQNCILGGATSTSNGLTCITNFSLPGTLSLSNNNVINNAITATSATSGTIAGITNSGACGTLNINSNIVRNLASTSTSGQVQGIINSGAVVTTINMNSNQLGNAIGGFYTGSAVSSGTLFGISTSAGAATCALSITGNDIRGITYSNATVSTAANTYIINSGATLSQNISNNTFTNLTIFSTGTTTFISNSVNAPATGFKTINGNNIVIAFNRTGTTGTVALYTDGGSSVCTAGVQNNNNNFSNITLAGTTSITGWFNNDGTGATPTKTITGNIFNNWTVGTGAITCLQSNFGNPASFSGNIITNITGQSNITGINLGSSGTIAALNISNNTVTGLNSTGATGGAVTGINSAAPSTAITNINGNTINTLASTSTTATVAGIFTAASTNIFNNKINTISCLGTTSGVSNGIMFTAGTVANIYKNKIYDLSTTGAFTATPGAVNGIVLSGAVASVTANVYNNYIGDLKASTATSPDAIRGISVTATGVTSTYRLYNNTVYLNATSATTLSSTGVFHAASGTATTATLDLRNNIIINLSSASGTGIASALKRSVAATLGNFATTSNNNLLFAGVPSATRAILADAATLYPAFTGAGSYQALVTPRETSSFTGESTFDYTVTSGATQFFQSLTPSAATYLHILAGITTQVESGAATISTPAITDDFDADVRNVTTPDVGADEFVGVKPTPTVTFTSIAPNTQQCAATPRVVTVSATTVAGTITGVVLNYSYNAVAQTPITMTNPSGTTWTGTILAPTAPTNATVTWSVTATNSIPLTGSYTGTAYNDVPLFGATATATALPTTICAGLNTVLTASLTNISSSQIGAGATSNITTTAVGAFYGSYWGNGHAQIIYTAAELSAAGFTAGNFTSLGVNISALGTPASLTNYTIKIGATAATTITTFQAPVFTTVFTAASYTPIVGLNTHTFSTPFTWNGTSNIIVDYCFANSVTGTSSAVNTYSVVASSFVNYNADGAGGAGACTTTTVSNTSSNRPNLIFTGNKAPAITNLVWNDAVPTNVGILNPLTYAPPTSTSFTATITAAGCPINTNAVAVTVNPLPALPTNTSTTPQCGSLTFSISTAVASPIYKWYTVATGGSPIAGATSSTYVLASPIAGLNTLWATVTNSNGCESPRFKIDITSTNAPILTASAAQVVCNNTIANVNITSLNTDYTTYTWSISPATSLYSDAAASIAYANGTDVYIKTTSPGLYTLTANATNSGTGCTAVIINTTVFVQPVVTGYTAPTSTYCLTGTPTLSATPASGYAAGTLQWQSSTTALAGPYTDIIGATSATYTPAAALTTTTYYQLIVKDGSGAACGTAPQFTVTINNPSVTSLGDVTRCGTGTVPLAVTASAGATVNWYANSIGGVSLGTGATFTTPSISITTPYYVSSSFVGSAINSSIGAATTLTGATTQPTAFCNRWTSYRHQYIYTAAELIAAGYSAGNIQSMAYNITTLGDAATNNNFTVKIGNTALSVYTVFVNAGLTTVYGPSTYTHTASGVQTITFATPYVWDGVSNIIVDVTMDGVNNINNSITYFTATGSAMGGYSTNGGTTATTTTSRLNTTFTIQSICASSPRTLVTATVTTAPAFAISNPAPATLAVCNGAITQFDATYTATDYSTVTWTTTNGTLYTDAAATSTYTAGSNAITVYLVATTPGSAIVTANAGNGGGLSCSAISTKTLTVLPASLIATASPAAICVTGTTTLSLAPSTAASYTGATIQWQSSPDGSTAWVNIAGANALTYVTPTISTTSYFRATILNTAAVVCANTSNVLTINVNNPLITATTPGTRCGVGTVLLDATATGATNYNWYAAPTGGTPLQTATTSSFTTPSITATTNYYVSASVGIPLNAVVGAGALTASSGGLSPYYHGWGGVKSQFIILASELNVAGLTPGNISALTFEITTLGTATFNNFSINVGNTNQTVATVTNIGGTSQVYSNAAQTLTLGLNTYSFSTPYYWDGVSNIVVQTCYSNVNTGGTSSTVKYDNPGFTSATYTYADNQTAAAILLTSTGSTGGSGGSLAVSGRPRMTLLQTPCESPRIPVTATVTPAPAITAPANIAICSGNSTNLTVTSGNAGYTYGWSPATGLSASTGATVSANPTTTQTYTITATDASSGPSAGCVTTGTVTVSVNPSPTAVTVTPASATICENSIQALTVSGGLVNNVSILSENFDANAPTWTITNAGTSPAISNFAYQTAPLTDAAGAATFSNFSTVQGGKFAYANSDAGGSGTTTNTVLTSPNFSTVGFTAANVNFEQAFRLYSGDVTVKLQYTIDGTTWVDLVNYLGTSIGNTTNNAQTTANTTVALPAGALNQPTVKIRYNYVSVWGFYWIIDNIQISGTATGNTTWSPATGLYTNPAATTAYTAGANATTVYVKTSTSQLYTATVTSATGCPASGTSNITITPQPTATIAYPGTPFCAGGTATVTTLGVGNTGGTYTSTPVGLVINASTGDVDLVASTAGTYTVTYTKAAAGGCALYTTNTSITIKATGTWLGVVDTDWNKAANWCGGVPTSATNVTIPAGAPNYPLINIGTASANNIAIATGATVTVNGTGIFNLYGEVTSNADNFDLTDGNLVFAGVDGDLGGLAAVLPLSGFSIKNKTIKNLTVSRYSDLSSTVGDTVKVTGKVSFEGNGNVLFTEDNLTLVSTLAATASLADITNNGANNGNSVVGKVNVERHIEQNRKWRFLAINTTGAQTINSSWMEGQTPGTAGVTGRGLWITRGTADPSTTGFDATSPTASMKWWNNSTYAYVNITDPTAFDIKSKSAYMTFVRGDRNSTGTNSLVSPTVIRTTGELIIGTTAAVNVLAGPNYTAVGNPYASAVDLTKLIYAPIASSNLTVALWDPKLTGVNGLGGFQYLAYGTFGPNFYISPGGGSYVGTAFNQPMNIIESGQAFFIQGSGTNRTVSFQELAKTPKAHDVFFTNGNPQVIAARLSIKDPTTTTLVDGIMVDIKNVYSNSVDADDARKLLNTSENVSIKTNNSLLAIERKALIQDNDSIHINMTGLRVKNYQWNIDVSNLDEPGRTGYLIDRFLNTTKLLDLNAGNLVDFAVTSVAGSFAANRFVIVFKQAAIPAVAVTLVANREANEQVALKWTAANEAYMNNYQVQRSANGTSFTTIADNAATTNNGTAVLYNKQDALATKEANYYRIKANLANGTIVYSNIAKVEAIVKGSYVNVYPNPVKEAVVNLLFANKPMGNCAVQMIDKQGKTVLTASLKIASIKETKAINIGAATQAGTYTFVFIYDNGERETKEVVVE